MNIIQTWKSRELPSHYIPFYENQILWYIGGAMALVADGGAKYVAGEVYDRLIK